MSEDQQKVGEPEKSFEATDQNVGTFVPQDEALHQVVFKEDRAFELFVGGERILFMGRRPNPVWPAKYADGLPDRVLDHPDFKTHANYFNVAR